MNLQQAPAEVQLAVDLIELLEVNQVAPDVALAALAMVTRDFERKLAQKKPQADS
ncbi:MAG: pleiotropic regulatory protein RsmS [Gammaproteobacteria bacterium]|nr:pleiotropic regulatory protein RsmS [Gammaproteobacteria bacterium]